MVGVARLALALLLPAATVAWAAGARAAPGAALEDPLTRGRLLLQAGDRYGALREFSRALSDHPDNVDARRAVADVLVELGAPQAAARTLGPGVDIGLRSRLAARRFLPAAELRRAGHRALVRAAGIVVGRQRPGTATGIVFVTLEDESGLTNVVVHPQLVEKQRRELLGARLLGVYGQLQVEGEVVHLVAKRLVDLSSWLGRLETVSRDFH